MAKHVAHPLIATTSVLRLKGCCLSGCNKRWLNLDLVAKAKSRWIELSSCDPSFFGCFYMPRTANNKAHWMAHKSRPAGCKVSIGRMLDAAPAALGFSKYGFHESFQLPLLLKNSLINFMFRSYFKTCKRLKSMIFLQNSH